MIYKFPLRIPKGRVVSITQGFKSTELANWYKERGINIIEHMAIDVECGNAVETYGTPLICPFGHANLVEGNLVHADPEKGISGRILIETIDDREHKLVMGAIHLSKVVEQRVYHEGDVLGYIGNYGPVRPTPTIGRPFDGAHVHISLIDNGVVVDPAQYFDMADPYRGADAGVAFDLPAIKWAIVKKSRL